TKRRQRAGVGRHREVGEVAPHHGPQPLPLLIDRPVPDPPERFRDLLEFGSHSCSLRPAPELEVGAVLPGAAIVRKPQEIERLRLTFTPLPATFSSKCAELDQAGFLRVQAQCELGQAVFEIAQKALRITPVLEAHNGVSAYLTTIMSPAACRLRHCCTQRS